MKTGRRIVWMTAAVALAACGEHNHNAIDTPTLMRVVKQAGFEHLQVLSNKAALAQLARWLRRPALANNAIDEDTILSRGYPNPLLMPLTAVRFPSTRTADKRVKNDHRFSKAL